MFTKYVNEEKIRTVGPALVIVLELEAPPRFLSMASTAAEFEHLLRWIDLDERTSEIVSAYFDQEQRDELERTKLHEYRLSEATPLEVGERVLSH